MKGKKTLVEEYVQTHINHGFMSPKLTLNQRLKGIKPYNP